MPQNADRILTTHVGSLIRPPKLIEFWRAIEDGKPYDEAAFETCLTESVATVVRQQAEVGIDIVSDGEFSKGVNWAFYVHKRLSGITVRPATPDEVKDPMASMGGGRDHRAFPEFYAEYDAATGLGKRLGNRVVVNGPIQYSNQQVLRDIQNLKAGVAKVKDRFRRWLRSCRSSRPRAPCPAPRSSTTRTKRHSYSRSPTPCTRNTGRSSTPDFTCRSTMPSCPTCTSAWCRR